MTVYKGDCAIQTVTLNFFRFDTWRQRSWAFAQMGLARRHMARLPGVQFWKLCGSGTGEGFTPIPNTAVYAILCVWDTPQCAADGLNADLFQTWHQHATESYAVFLKPVSCRGAWSSRAPFHPQEPTLGPIAALTRATIKPKIIFKFWGRVPRISKMIGNDPNVMFKIGIGEVPWLHQITFSVWPDKSSMAAFARENGPHADAIKAVRSENWFSEELYARFSVLGTEGTWHGRDPIKGIDVTS